MRKIADSGKKLEKDMIKVQKYIEEGKEKSEDEDY